MSTCMDHRFHNPAWKLKFWVTSSSHKYNSHPWVWSGLIWPLFFLDRTWIRAQNFIVLLLCLSLNPGPLNLHTVYIWGWIFLYSGEGCSVHGGMFSTISDFYPLDSRNTPTPIVTTKNISRHCQTSLGGQNSPQLRTTGPNGKGALPAITKNLFFFNHLSSWQCDSLFSANPTSHKWPIYGLLAPDYNVLSSNPSSPKSVTSATDMLLSG